MPRNAAKSGRPAAPESAVSPLLLPEALRSRHGPPCPGRYGAAAVCAARGGARRAAVLQTAAQEAILKRSWRWNVARGPKRRPCPNLDELPTVRNFSARPQNSHLISTDQTRDRHSELRTILPALSYSFGVARGRCAGGALPQRRRTGRAGRAHAKCRARFSAGTRAPSERTKLVI